MTNPTTRATIEQVYDSWQPSLFAGAEPSIDEGYPTIERRLLDDDSWIDHAPGWLAGADRVFETLITGLPWRQRDVVMYDRALAEPRLTWWWSAADEAAEPFPVLAEVRSALSERYEIGLDSIGCNWYRDGRDSVAWHGDRVQHLSQPLVAIVSVGSPRPFLVRRRGGGPSIKFSLGEGDLLVMGGRCQHDWQHCVPKVAKAGPRLSITFRHATEPADVAVVPMAERV